MKLKVFIFLIVFFIFFGWGDKIIPSRVEIDELQMVETLGLDKSSNDLVTLSFAVEKHSVKSKDNNEKDNTEKKDNIVMITGESFANCVRTLQSYSNKLFIGGHTKSVIIGEKMARENLIEGIDFMAKDRQVRHSTDIYIVMNDSSANTFLEGRNSEYLISERMNNLLSSIRGSSAKREVPLIDVMNILISQDKTGIIPCIKIVENEEIQNNTYLTESDDKNKTRIEFAGYGIIKDGRLIDYITESNGRGYEIIKNNSTISAVNLENDGEEITALNLTDAHSTFDFKFEGNNLKEIILNVKILSNINESAGGRNLFNEGIEKYEKYESEIIKKEIEGVFMLMNKNKADFLDISEKLKFKHPYKWRKIKDKWDNILYNVPITVNVKSVIDRTYDVYSINNEG